MYIQCDRIWKHFTFINILLNWVEKKCYTHAYMHKLCCTGCLYIYLYILLGGYDKEWYQSPGVDSVDCLPTWSWNLWSITISISFILCYNALYISWIILAICYKQNGIAVMVRTMSERSSGARTPREQTPIPNNGRDVIINRLTELVEW